MMIYNFNVCNDKLSLSGNFCANTGNLNYYLCRFKFDGVWEGLKKFAVFIKDDATYTCMIEGDECYIPYELLETAATVSVGVYGSSLDEENPLRISTDFSHIVIKEGAYREGTEPSVPEAQLWEMYFQKVAETASRTAVGAVEQYLTDVDNTLKDIDSSLAHIIEIQNALVGGVRP